MRLTKNTSKDLWSAAADGRQIRGYAVVSYRAVQFNATGLAFALFQASCDPVCLLFTTGITASQGGRRRASGLQGLDQKFGTSLGEVAIGSVRRRYGCPALSTTNLDVWYLFPLAGVYRNAPNDWAKLTKAGYNHEDSRY